MGKSFRSIFVEKARSIYGNEFIPLHRPVFEGNERQYLVDCIDSNFVSSVGSKVDEFERKIAEYTGSKFAIATVNGTAALHTAAEVCGVKKNDEVITQALTFVATCNAISYIGAHPVFIDVDLDTMGLSPRSLKRFLESNAKLCGGVAINKKTGRTISACIPMHTFGLPCRAKELSDICAEWNIALIEDAAESLGSFIDGKHTGTFGQVGTISFNGNKVITTGGGGMIITDDADIAKRAKHITTTAKVPHPYEFVHDAVGYNYRLPNLNAALGCAQMEKFTEMLEIKRNLSACWEEFCKNEKVSFVKEVDGYNSNYWLNAIILESATKRNDFIAYTNGQGVMTRPIWTLMSNLSMFSACLKDDLANSLWLQDRVVNIPSSVPNGYLTKD